MIAFISWF